MDSPALSSIDVAILRQVALPAIAPLSDKTLRSVARRVALPESQVEAALEHLAALKPPLVHRLVDSRLGEFWIGMRAGQAALEPTAGTPHAI